MKKALISGVSGFVGVYLARHLQSLGYAVAGFDQAPSCPVAGVRYEKIDLLSGKQLTRFVESVAPDELYHLAGVSYLPDADESPAFAFSVNLIGALSVFDAVRRAGLGACRILQVGSSKEYRTGDSAVPLVETMQPCPDNFYAITKYGAELAGKRYCSQFGMDIRFTRSFNHTGPGQSPKFVCSDWAMQVARIMRGTQKPVMEVGDTAPEMDFCDVRDVVRAYHAVLDRGRSGEVYNVCSGRSVPLGYILEVLTAQAGRPVTIRQSGTKIRGHTDHPRIVGSNEKLRAECAWTPEIPLEQTLEDTLAFWKAGLPA